MNWIRIASDMKSDASVGSIAEACDIGIGSAVGHVVNVLGEMATQAKDGMVRDVPDRTIELWAAWDGARGVFAKAFRAALCTEAGVVRAWEKYNGAAIRKAEHDMERKRTARGRRADGARTSTGQPRNRRADGATTARVDGDGDVDGNVLTTTSNEVVVSGDAARRLTAAANKGITEQFGEQPVPIRWDHPSTAATVARLTEAGVPLDDAERWLFDIARSRAPSDGRPPRTLRYYAEAIVQAWTAEQAHRDAATLPRPAATGTVITWEDVMREANAPEVRHVA